MVVMSLAAVTPVFTIAKIDSLIHFQETSDMGDILVCRETWTPKIRMAYKLTTCTFQFVVPVVLVVSLKNCCTMTIQFTDETEKRISSFSNVFKTKLGCIR